MMKTTILSVLNACASAHYSLTTSTLKTQVQSRVGGKVGDTDFETELSALVASGLVGTRRAPVTNDTLYFITGAGKVAQEQ